ncbi:MAG: LysR family transcriptional regulator [Synechococcales cyanobacterium RU_4_20]|nr:LysR family transcriptional regulator [Synechococcales cyanobacterium RU_4_20]NJR67353.1 LysR family transcriptional regulator [Synechococcales cyanobacterium CRU_2_2]
MNLSQIRAVVAVAEHRNFSAAALALELSQSTVSHAIATLEAELGVALFKRGRLGAVPTPAGDRIVQQARLVLQHLQNITLEAYKHRSLSGGEVRIATFRSVATHLLPEVIAQFSVQYPEIKVTLIEQAHYIAIEQCLREGQADIGFTYQPAASDLEVFEVIRDEYIALLPPHATPLHASLTWQDLSTYGLLLVPCLPCGVALHQHLKCHAPELKINDSIREDSTAISMINRGLAAGIFPHLAAAPIPPDIHCRSLPQPYWRTILAARLLDTDHPPAVFAFWELLAARLAASSTAAELPSRLPSTPSILPAVQRYP